MDEKEIGRKEGRKGRKESMIVNEGDKRDMDGQM